MEYTLLDVRASGQAALIPLGAHRVCSTLPTGVWLLNCPESDLVRHRRPRPGVDRLAATPRPNRPRRPSVGTPTPPAPFLHHPHRPGPRRPADPTPLRPPPPGSRCSQQRSPLWPCSATNQPTRNAPPQAETPRGIAETPRPERPPGNCHTHPAESDPHDGHSRPQRPRGRGVKHPG